MVHSNEGVLRMELSTVSGLALGFVILALALVLGHVPLETLFNPEALLIVFGGTMTATMVGFNQATLLNALNALRGGTAEGRLDTRETIQYVMEVVGFVRDEGILALQPIIESIEIPFFKKGLNLVLDNRTEKFVRDSLTTEIEVIYRQNMDCARVYETAGGYAPTMGIIGAVIGLIYIVQAFNDPAQLGRGVASAFSATLYGVALSNLFLLPVAGKLRQRARDEWFIRTLLLEAILSIRSGEHPMLIEERLNAFIYTPEGSDLSPSGRRAKAYASRPASSLPQAGTLPANAVLDDDFLQVIAEEHSRR
jgi:chemotaxis protein MotA